MKRAWVLVVLLPSALPADDVFLKGAGQITGRIVARSATSLEVDVGAGSVTVPLAQVERIQQGRCALDDYHERAQALAANDRGGWLSLARWASSQGLAKQAEEAYKRVLAIAPDEPEANQALGKVRLGQRWVSEEESYRARGYVEFEGEWITPAEHAAILATREADERREAAETQAREAEDRARDAAARAAEQKAQQRSPLWWGAWGPGPQAWVGTTFQVDPQAGRGPR
jgi:tetratricopeptide (TPR) repeat protein